MSKSLLQDKKECYVSHTTLNLDRHHIMNGNAYRRKAEEDGLWVWLRHDVHMKLHNTSDGRRYATSLKAEAQKAYEENLMNQYAYSADQARNEWMKRYKKNYL